jgi:acylphosphatase
MVKHLNINITGQVQGVAFRYSAQKEAEKLGIAGFAQNLPDGTVYIEAEGEEVVLKEFLDWCQNGSGLAKVEKVESKEAPLSNFLGFSIK